MKNLTKFGKLFCMGLAIALALGSCSPKEEPVKNIIYLIGDGMGFGAVSSLLLTEDSLTGFEQQAVIGLSETCSANNHVTDSPAGGTALATAVRSANGRVGVDINGVPLESILMKAQKFGKKSGIVVNTTLTEATPAAFYAHVLDRSRGYEIADHFVKSGVDVAIGSGLSAFINRPDSVDHTATLINDGYDVYLNWSDVLASESDKFVGILPMDAVHRRNKNKTQAGAADGAQVCLAARLASGGESATSGSSAAASGDISVSGDVAENAVGKQNEPELYLEKAVAKALQLLHKKGKESGFFLMIESAIIDGYGHNNDSEGMIEEMQEFDRTLQFLIKYVNKYPNTLLVVTADHETGGTCVAYNEHTPGQKDTVKLSFNTKGHTGTVVPVFAYGAGAKYFGGVMKNTDIPLRMELLMRQK